MWQANLTSHFKAERYPFFASLVQHLAVLVPLLLLLAATRMGILECPVAKASHVKAQRYVRSAAGRKHWCDVLHGACWYRCMLDAASLEGCIAGCSLPSAEVVLHAEWCIAAGSGALCIVACMS